MLKPGDTVTSNRFGGLRVVDTLGEGGQGWVYRVSTASGGELALKWYKPVAAVAEQWNALTYLMGRKTPDSRFLWPLDIVGSLERGRFGYVMMLRPPEYLGLGSLVLGRASDGKPLNVRSVAVVDMCRQLAETFLRLHAQGLCYRDINLGNVFFEPTSGNTLICDVDNVGIDDGTSRILGTGRFMAPEIVRDVTEKTLPSTYTDRHSLAVLLFIALFIEHPLEGERSDHGLRDDEHLREHFGVHPLFNLHDTDTRNRPIQAHVRKYWDEVYPEFLKNLFRTAFVDGLSRPGHRVTEGQWVRALTRLREVMAPCPTCRKTVYHDPAALAQVCWGCRAELPDPSVVRIGSRSVVVGPEMVVWADQRGPGERGRPVGRGIAHPADPTRIGLHNVSPESWTARYPDGSERTVTPGQAAALIDGAEFVIQGTIASVEKRSSRREVGSLSTRDELRRSR
jgi:DNA-binding helix-hairpin-helix protein with protein kinase domain